MADRPLRTLERALAAGEEGSRVSLAAAYLRQGQPGAAVEVLDEAPALPTDATALYEAAWRQRLGRLEPAAAFPEARDYARLVGFAGAGDRYAVLRATRPRVVDLAEGRPVDGALTPGATPLAARPDGLLCHRPGRLVWVRPDGWREEPALASFVVPPRPWGADTEVALAPAGDVLLVGGTAISLAGGALLERASLPGGAPVAVDWGARRLAWWADGKLVTDGLEGPSAPRRLDPFGAYRRLHPARAARRGAGPSRPAVFGLLADGRVLVGPPLALVDLDSGRSTFPPAGDGGDLVGPARLARDREAVLVFRGGLPARIPLSAEPSPWAADPAPVVAAGAAREWHPRAAVAAVGAGPRGVPEVIATTGEAVRALPRDAWPLGWTPDGLGLLLVRGVGVDSGVLELWRAGP